ncbi:MAG TPA: FHA domain-containing protein, partial [Polyangiaceae bacterium]|nr:FHA domain-containing protein [Polyangiaceae bacterium]
MGFIQSVRDPRRWAVMKQNFLIGRDEICDLVLPRPGISKRHALICWDGQHWMLRDLMSRNGTHVRARGEKGPVRAPGDRPVQLALHDSLTFAETDEEWTLVNVDMPRTLLAEEGREPDSIIVLDPTGVVAVPSEAQVHFVMHRDHASGDWILEEPGVDPRVVTDGELIRIEDHSYRLYIVEASDTREAESAPPGLSLSEIELDLLPTPDEEGATLLLRAGRTSVTSPLHAHLYLLVYLARCRLKDAREGKAEDHCGWLSSDEVQSALGYGSPQHLAVDVYRCRKDLKDLSVWNATEIVERGRHGHLRIGLKSQRLRVVP